MKRVSSIVAALALVAASVAPAGAAPNGTTTYALKGTARALELALGNQGLTLGFSLAEADSTPHARGVGAGQCEVIPADSDPDGLPCSDQTTVTSEYPGDPGSAKPKCLAGLPEALSAVLTLDLACGSSRSLLKKGVPTTASTGKIAGLSATLPVGLSLVPVDLSTEQVEEVVDTLTDALAPVLDEAPQEVRDTLTGAEDTAFETVGGLLEIVQGIDATDALKVEVGPSASSVKRKGKAIEVSTDAAGAKVGILGIPAGVTKSGGVLGANPLETGLVIIEVGRAQASASVNTTDAGSTSAASPALVTVRVRDITKPEPTYVEVSVAPGETVTVLQGTPAESTITAADSTTEQGDGSARAAADAVRLHLLKGVQGGINLALGRVEVSATAAAVAPKAIQKRAPRILPQTGARDMSLIALVLLVTAAGVFVLRRRFNN